MTSTIERPVQDSPPANRARNIALLVGGVLLLVVLVLLGAWAVDTAVGGTQVQHNVSVAGHDVGGKSEDDLVPVLEDVSAHVSDTTVELQLPQTSLTSTAKALGLQLDETATAKAALAIGRNDPLPLRPVVWLASFFHHRAAEVHFTVEGAQLATELNRLDAQVRTAPQEPTLSYQDGEVVAMPGKEGTGLDVAQVSNELAQVQDVGDGKITIEAHTAPVPPTVGIAQAQALADKVNAATKSPLPVSFGDDAQEIPGDALRRLVRLGPDGNVALDDAGTVDLLGTLFPDVGEAPVDATMAVNDSGVVTIEKGQDGTVCCDPASVAGIAQALTGGAANPVALQLRTQPPARTADSLAQLGVVEKVAEFTTRHPSGAPRVTNIHRMADIVQGAIIQPGDTFSVNDYVGRRTVANGFVSAPIIGENGYFTDDIGGGVSQFATTLFNAAFFAGLEIPAYQAHGIYISRYPYGREATLDYGNIDLQIRNNTPYGVLIWPTYTDSSITVALYSTRYIEAGQSDQTTQPYGAVCTQVTTVRQRTWLTTGEVKYDNFYATYTPDEGIECDGTQLTNPNAPETTTTAADPNATSTSAAPGAPSPSAGPSPPTTAATPGAPDTSAAGAAAPTSSTPS